ncbi:MAG: class II glutamine amidotransferase [Prevotellaceae bacterium]|jgi:predicted glutamine amidotransferase|nr:class II glutamine amidotransferase [Prevotellaceae bacterium]
MCLIIVKPAGAKMPAKNIIKTAAKINSHGFGFCTETKYFRALKFAEFEKQLQKIEINENAIIHFRLATHGSIKVQNCHPFYKNNIFFAHNGVLNLATFNDKTDSEMFFINEVLPLAKKKCFASQYFDFYMKQCAINNYSRFAMLADGKLKMYGLFEQYKDCFYSNMRVFNYENYYSKYYYNKLTF